MSSKDVGNIFKEKDLRLKSFYCIDKDGESVSSIFHSHLIAKSTERLTRGATNNNVYLLVFWVFKTNF